jgi:hypothetical protein
MADPSRSGRSRRDDQVAAKQLNRLKQANHIDLQPCSHKPHFENA